MGRQRVFVASAASLLMAGAWIAAIALAGPRLDPDAQLDRILAARPDLRIPGVVRQEVRAFYDGRRLAPAWIDGETLSPQVKAALAVLGAARSLGLDPRDYDVTRLSADYRRLIATPDDRRHSAKYENALLDFDVRLTSSLLMLGHDAAAAGTNLAVWLNAIVATGSLNPVS